jgi:hypothetical protein
MDVTIKEALDVADAFLAARAKKIPMVPLVVAPL